MPFTRPTQTDATKLKDVVGQQFTIVDWEKKFSKKFKSDFVLIEALDSEGNDVVLMGGGFLDRLLSENRDELPAEVIVTSFPTDFGNDGYGLEPVDGFVE